MTPSECIKSVRLHIGQNQTEFAKTIGMDKTSVCMYESGKRLPSFPTMRAIVEVARKNGLDISYTDIRSD
jgi:DNA-binding XRE family transcriptional regulator